MLTAITVLLRYRTLELCTSSGCISLFGYLLSKLPQSFLDYSGHYSTLIFVINFFRSPRMSGNNHCLRFCPLLIHVTESLQFGHIHSAISNGICTFYLLVVHCVSILHFPFMFLPMNSMVGSKSWIL